ncbi:uncharacterized protein LOC119102339 [Pollicipes pollicipes]|uniref:uncharacterized protein LOC119102339 n=1 Tax=Pollicipes pollicipes TaxID=41117 RepID=UPI001884D151|nr:uncharacterized protein LOC119102339 [Pollicipes pollicipes]
MGSLVHILPEKQQRKAPKIRRGPLDGFTRKSDRDKELIRQCFLFSNHLILATRTSNGHLHLINGIGRVSLADAILIEDPSENDDDLDSETSSSTSSLSDNSTVGQLRREHIGLDFKLIVERKGDTHLVLHLVAPTAQEKAAWVSDIAQCLDNVQFNNWFRSSVSDTSSVTMPHSIRNDPKLFRDDIDIRFSKTLNSCKVPQVRYATPERLLERLTDLRFLSIDFLNTFLLTYRVFTDGVTVLNALKTVYFSAEKGDSDDPTSPPGEARRRESALSTTLRIGQGESSRRISTASTVSCVSACSEGNVFESPLRGQHWRWTHRRFEEELRTNPDSLGGSAASSLAVGGLQQIKEQPSPSGSDCSSQSHFVELRDKERDGQFLSVPPPAASAATAGGGSDSSSETLVGTASSSTSERTITPETVVELAAKRCPEPGSEPADRAPLGAPEPEKPQVAAAGRESETVVLLRERTDVIREEEEGEEEDTVPEGERSEGDGAEEQKPDEHKPKTEAEIASETRRKRKLYQKSESIVLEAEEPWMDRSFPSFASRGSTSLSCSDAFSIPRTSGYSDTLSIPRGSAFSDTMSIPRGILSSETRSARREAPRSAAPPRDSS